MMSLSLVAFGAQAVVCVGDTVVEEGPLVSAKPLVRLTSKAVGLQAEHSGKGVNAVEWNALMGPGRQVARVLDPT